MLSTEHRAAAASPPIHLTLVTTNPDTIHLEVVTQREHEKQRTLEAQVLDTLAGGMVLTRSKLRDSLAVKNERLGEVLESLELAGRLSRTAAGWQRLD